MFCFKEDLDKLDRVTSYFEEDCTERNYGGQDTILKCKLDSCYYKEDCVKDLCCE